MAGKPVRASLKPSLIAFGSKGTGSPPWLLKFLRSPPSGRSPPAQRADRTKGALVHVSHFLGF